MSKRLLGNGLAFLCVLLALVEAEENAQEDEDDAD